MAAEEEEGNIDVIDAEGRLFKAFPKIKQYRDAIREITNRVNKKGDFEQGTDELTFTGTELPTLNFRGTVKLHGTNAAIAIRPDGSFYAQSRSRILSVEKDNMGFAQFVHNSVGAERIQKVVAALGERAPAFVFGEWCGQGIQNNVGIAQLEKMFVVFGVFDKDGRWGSEEVIRSVATAFEHPRVFYNFQFPHFELTIDFNRPETGQARLAQITTEVEKECPVAKHFGVSGIGEGVVWCCTDPGWYSSRYWFKVKGNEHSVSKVKTLANINPEKVNSAREFADNTVTEARLEQGLSVMREKGIEATKANTGKFVSWVVDDIMAEEADTLAANGLVAKDVNNFISTKARSWYLARQ